MVGSVPYGLVRWAGMSLILGGILRTAYCVLKMSSFVAAVWDSATAEHAEQLSRQCSAAPATAVQHCTSGSPATPSAIISLLGAGAESLSGLCWRTPARRPAGPASTGLYSLACIIIMAIVVVSCVPRASVGPGHRQSSATAAHDLFLANDKA